MRDAMDVGGVTRRMTQARGRRGRVAFGVDPVHFSIVFTHNMEIALVHPPVGLNLFVLSTISHAPIGEVVRGVLPFFILLLMVLMIITYVPALTM
jgi:C4-dicarboxylate transporter, DctM subunit